MAFNLKVPADWSGTTPEYFVWWALNRIIPGQFTFQQSMGGGRQVRGGLVVDFFVPSLQLIIQVEGAFWHDEFSQSVEDQIQQIILESQGNTVIYISEEDALANPIFYVSEALKFNQVSR